jgi:NAD-dependent DNA ligase
MADRIYILKRAGQLGPDGQPLNRNWNAKRLTDRSTDELIGICRGLIVDKAVTEEEVSFLNSWLNTYRDVAGSWPGNVIAARLDKIFEDGIIDPEEREDLFKLLQEIAGQKSHILSSNYSTTLPFTKPAPPIIFADQDFCLTGRFAWGPRAHCETEIKSRGGRTQPNVTQQTHFLVIGAIGSRDWLHSTHGRKIEHAVDLVSRHFPIAIVSEEHWADNLLPYSTQRVG